MELPKKATVNLFDQSKQPVLSSQKRAGSETKATGSLIARGVAPAGHLLQFSPVEDAGVAQRKRSRNDP